MNLTAHKTQENIRIRIDEAKQKEIFSDFLKKFKNDFFKASDYLRITSSSLSKYRRAVVKYLPREVLFRVINCLNVEQPEIIYSGTLTQIRRKYFKNAHPVLKQKYGKAWAKELTNRRDFKGIRLNDFPNSTFVYLKDEYRQQLFNAVHNLFGSLNKLARTIKVSPSTLSSWRYGNQKDYERNEERLQFIPLSKLKMISEFLIKDGRKEFSMENIEPQVLMHRMQAGNPINNPKFPIKESPELIRLLFHLLGDGYSGKKGENANYRNTCRKLLDEFKTDLRIFGDVPIHEQKDSIKFPRVLAQVIKNFYEIKCATFDSHISNKILQISARNLYFGIRAFGDDEGTVYPSSIRLSSANYTLISGIKQILNYSKIKSRDVKFQLNPNATCGKIYYLDINDLEQYYKHVGFSHPKKQILLEKYVKKKKSTRRKRLLKT
jgi:hypothetical protein